MKTRQATQRADLTGVTIAVTLRPSESNPPPFCVSVCLCWLSDAVITDTCHHPTCRPVCQQSTGGVSLCHHAGSAWPCGGAAVAQAAISGPAGQVGPDPGTGGCRPVRRGAETCGAEAVRRTCEAWHGGQGCKEVTVGRDGKAV